MNASTETLVTAAYCLLHPAPGTVHSPAPGLRARAAAVLLRMALDQGLERLLSAGHPSMPLIGKHSMLCLEWYAGQDTARRCRTTWSTLTAACHDRTRELPPGPAEIRTRLLEVSGLLAARGAATVTGPTP
ncbi:hypothetical protein ABZY16_10785 [Streptomyces sp. NPDC006553]|uniref:hypothetical protein n=1 Tax=Streptomyces sp. NPDC006553 TaxID=3157180 RepID=UPI0033AB0B28